MQDVAATDLNTNQAAFSSSSFHTTIPRILVDDHVYLGKPKSGNPTILAWPMLSQV
ncbi:predicted protein [Plenodomus lingam JN3]|uniref:Predicted protein n=1 Tax=Leptosphaeria maculans (strain JN3 / isolate v23.1.3 / race Av1-4-5-6-7-8) TaxID=985895 RepID=E5AE71_LEPMJ|nr:predicted protein [Plenodomus lingam JN3]CBY01510.1 predicted protein [Plenodomus lingam JN3]